MRHNLRAAAVRVLSRPSTIDYNEPCIIKDSIMQWPAVRFRKWHPRRLRALYGDRLFECGQSAHNDEPLLITLDRFCNLKHPQSRRRWYIFDSTFDADCPELLEDYSVPSIFQFGALGSSCFPPGPDGQCSNRWLLMGHAGSGSRLHIDPQNTSAWNALVYGLKEWVIIQPVIAGDRPRGVSHLASPKDAPSFHQQIFARSASTPLNQWFAKNVPWLWRHAQCVAVSDSRPHSTRSLFTPRMMRFLQHPGDIVYVPRGWLHAVINRSLSVAVTHNFVSPECKVSLDVRVMGLVHQDGDAHRGQAVV
jgi:hypothetical protein